MNKTHQFHGCQFRYPSDWDIAEQDEEGQYTVTATSPTTAFWTLSLFVDRPDPEGLIEKVVDVFRNEYDEMDVYTTSKRVGRHKAVGCDIDFVCLDCLSIANVRSFRTRRFTVLILFQHVEAEHDDVQPILDDMTRSFICSAAEVELPVIEPPNDSTEDD